MLLQVSTDYCDLPNGRWWTKESQEPDKNWASLRLARIQTARDELAALCVYLDLVSSWGASDWSKTLEIKYPLRQFLLQIHISVLPRFGSWSVFDESQTQGWKKSESPWQRTLFKEPGARTPPVCRSDIPLSAKVFLGKLDSTVRFNRTTVYSVRLLGR